MCFVMFVGVVWCVSVVVCYNLYDVCRCGVVMWSDCRCEVVCLWWCVYGVVSDVFRCGVMHMCWCICVACMVCVHVGVGVQGCTNNSPI